MPEPATESCRNSRLRGKLRSEWFRVQAITHYWKAFLEFESALGIARVHDMREVAAFTDIIRPRRRGEYVKKYREVVVAQLLTPAPDVRAVMWKETTFKSGQHRHIGVEDDVIKRAIAKDKAFLDTHPTKRTKPKAGQPA